MSELLTAVAFIALAPLAGGLLAGADRVVSARMQRRVGPPLLQPFYDVGKLWRKTARPVNGLLEPLLLGHLGFMALAGALMAGGVDLLFAVFVFALAAVCLVLAASSADSPYSAIGAQRELVLVLASEPFFVLLVAAVCRITGATTLAGVAAAPAPAALSLPGVLAAFALVFALKLRKSPFDVSASHHAHQELVRGITSDMSGRQLVYVELAHWYETVTLLGLFVILFFGGHVVIGLVAALVLYLLVVLVDNATSRARWQLLLRTAWAATLVLVAGNLFGLYLLGW
jgi:formate hydrogenlyase subunit 4